MRKVIILLALFSTVIFAQEKGSFTDTRDKKSYKTVKIGTQTWMAQNLYYHGTDGFLGLCYDDEPKQKIKQPCENCGRLYDWDEAMKACPKGWHLPSNKEWQTLVDFAGGDEVAGKKLKAKKVWKELDFSRKSPNAPKCKWTEEEVDDRGRTTSIKEYDYCATDEYDFFALPCGLRHINGDYHSLLLSTSFWSATELNASHAWYRVLNAGNVNMRGYNFDKSVMFSVRCIRD